MVVRKTDRSCKWACNLVFHFEGRT